MQIESDVMPRGKLDVDQQHLLFKRDHDAPTVIAE